MLIRKLKTILVLAGVLFLSACIAAGGARYSDDPAAARIQALTDFCIGYGALRDAGKNFILVDAKRTTPILTEDIVLGYQQARTFIRPFCTPTFDPVSEPFDLKTLEKELLKIRLMLVQKENLT